MKEQFERGGREGEILIQFMLLNVISDAIFLFKCVVAAWEALMGIRMEASQVWHCEQIFILFVAVNKASIMVFPNTGCLLIDVPE